MFVGCRMSEYGIGFIEIVQFSQHIWLYRLCENWCEKYAMCTVCTDIRLDCLYAKLVSCLVMKPPDKMITRAGVGEKAKKAKKKKKSKNNEFVTHCYFRVWHFRCVTSICTKFARRSLTKYIQTKIVWMWCDRGSPFSLSIQNQFFNYNVADFRKNNFKRWTRSD